MCLWPQPVGQVPGMCIHEHCLHHLVALHWPRRESFTTAFALTEPNGHDTNYTEHPGLMSWDKIDRRYRLLTILKGLDYPSYRSVVHMVNSNVEDAEC